MIPGLCSLVYRGSSGTSAGLSATASPSALYGSNGQTVVGNCTAAPIGGTAPYTYSWTYYTGSTAVSPTSPTSATTGFDCGSLAPGDNISAFFVCTVTDNAGHSVQTNQVVAGFSLST